MTGIGQLVVVFLPRDREWICERRREISVIWLCKL